MYTNTIISHKNFLRSCLTFILAIFSIDKVQAEDISSVHMSFIDNDRTEDISSFFMSFTDPIASALPETPAPKTDRQNSIARNVSKQNEKVGWYFGTMRGANFPNLNVTTEQKSTGNWTGLDSLGSLLSLSNINAFAGYRSSNFRFEGEVMLANNPMTISASSSVPIIGQPDPKKPGQTIQNNNGFPKNCTANSFAMLLNGYYDVDMGGSLKPFIGAGIGYSSTNLKDSGLDWGSASGFTYQLKVGVGYPLSEGQDIYLQYKYINLPAKYVSQGGTPSDTNFNVGNIEIGTRFNF